MSTCVSRVRQVVQTNAPRDGPTLRRRNRKAERGAQVGIAEAVSAHKLPSPLDIAQRDMLAVPAHALKKHTIMHTLLALRHAGDVARAGPVQSPFSSGASPSNER